MMIQGLVKKFLSVALSLLLAVPFQAGAQQPAQPPAESDSTGHSGQGAPLSAEELQQLTAPIAPYPDALGL